MMLLSWGDAIREGSYHLHSRFKRAAHFYNGTDAVFLVDEEIGAGPSNVVVRGYGATETESLVVSPSEIVCGTSRWSRDEGLRYRSLLDEVLVDVQLARRNLGVLIETIQQDAPPASLAFLLKPHELKLKSTFDLECEKRIRLGVSLLMSGKVTAGIGKLKGCGCGLTPAGDDFIAGFLHALNVLGPFRRIENRRTIQRAMKVAAGNNPLVNLFLHQAAEGRLFEPLKNVAEKLVTGASSEVQSVTKHLMMHGETSGADLATGFAMTLQSDRFGLGGV